MMFKGINIYKYKNDIILVCSFILLAIILFIFLSYRYSNISGNEIVSIEIDGNIYKELPISQDQTVVVNSEYGTNTIMINNNSVHVIESDCPDHLCEKTKVSIFNGRRIICLPNHLTISIKNNNNLIDETVF